MGVEMKLNFIFQLSDKAQERKVPASRLGRVFTFGSELPLFFLSFQSYFIKLIKRLK